MESTSNQNADRGIAILVETKIIYIDSWLSPFTSSRNNVPAISDRIWIHTPKKVWWPIKWETGRCWRRGHGRFREDDEEKKKIKRRNIKEENSGKTANKTRKLRPFINEYDRNPDTNNIYATNTDIQQSALRCVCNQINFFIHTIGVTWRQRQYQMITRNMGAICIIKLLNQRILSLYTPLLDQILEMTDDSLSPNNEMESYKVNYGEKIMYTSFPPVSGAAENFCFSRLGVIHVLLKYPTKDLYPYTGEGLSGQETVLVDQKGEKCARYKAPCWTHMAMVTSLMWFKKARSPSSCQDEMTVR